MHGWSRDLQQPKEDSNQKEPRCDLPHGEAKGASFRHVPTQRQAANKFSAREDVPIASRMGPSPARRERGAYRRLNDSVPDQPHERVRTRSIATPKVGEHGTLPEPPPSTAVVDFDPLSTLEAIHSCLVTENIEEDEAFQAAHEIFEPLQAAFRFGSQTSSLFAHTADHEEDLSIPYSISLNDVPLVTATVFSELSIPTAVPLASIPSPFVPVPTHSGYIPQGEFSASLAACVTLH
jgi:hypothetical protein